MLAALQLDLVSVNRGYCFDRRRKFAIIIAILGPLEPALGSLSAAYVLAALDQPSSEDQIILLQISQSVRQFAPGKIAISLVSEWQIPRSHKIGTDVTGI